MIYLDYASTTYCDERVLDAMHPYWNVMFGNPHSRSHKFGWESENAIEVARKQIANLINVNADEIIFTSGATESNNLAIKGFVNGPNYIKGKKILSVLTEHKCVIETVRSCARDGILVEFLSVNNDGLIDLNELEKKLENCALFSISYINNETGVVQDIAKISEICRKNKVFLHVDAAQAFGKIEIDARLVDMLSISGHKIYGPKGIGALFVSKKPTRVRLKELISGGGQERGMRSGTLPTPLCVGLGKAAFIAKEEMHRDYEKFQKFHQMIVSQVVDSMEELYINGSVSNKIPNILNLSIPYVEGESMMMRMSEFALASGSACTSKSLEPSHVISSMHPENKDLAHSSLRISFGRKTTQEEIEKLIIALKKNIIELRELSPLWKMFKAGVDLSKIHWGH